MNEFWSMLLALKAQGASTATIEAAVAAWLEEHPVKGYTVLVKGSRGTLMEKVIASL